MKKRIFALIIAVLMLISMAGCAGDAPEVPEAPINDPSAPSTLPDAPEDVVDPDAPVYGGVLKYAHNAQGKFSGYPVDMGNTYERIAFPAIEKLFYVDENLQPVPHLASGLITDPENNTVTITLKEGIKFHDGSDFNAEAVKWNIEQHVQAGTSAAASIDTVDAVDEYTVRINLKQWDSGLALALTQTLGMMISKEATEKNGVEWARENPCGTGPFVFVSWTKDVNVVYEKNENYWQEGKPYLDGVEFVFIADRNTKQMALQNGDVDVIGGTNGKALQELEAAGFVVNRMVTGSGAGGLLPSSANEDSPWADVLVRRAANYAINWEAVGKAAFSGENEVANQYAAVTHWAYNPDVEGYPYNPEKAKELLAEAGYPDGFESTLMYSASSEGADMVALAIQGFLSEVGIDIELDAAESARFYTMYNGTEPWEGLILSTRSGNIDFFGQMFARNGGTGKNVSMYVSPEFQELINLSRSSTTFEDQQKYMWDAQKVMIDEDCEIIFGYNAYDAAVNADYVHGTEMFQNADGAQWKPENTWMSEH